MSIDKKFFDSLYKCRESFCKFDDYNWDWSIQSLVGSCMPKLQTLVLLAPRILHVGDCQGFHVKNTNRKCDMDSLQRKYAPLLAESDSPFIDSEYFTHAHKLKNNKHGFKPNGGWADPRDHALCINYNIS